MGSVKGCYGKKLIIVAMFLMMLTGCVFHKKTEMIDRHSEELESEVLEENDPKAREWFQKNRPDALDISVNYYWRFEKMSSNIVTGYYQKDDLLYKYLLNVDNGFCLTNENYGRCILALRTKLAEELELDVFDVRIDNYMENFNMRLVSDLDEKGKRMKTKEYEDVEEQVLEYAPWNIDETNVDSYIEEAMHRVQYNIYIKVDKYSDAKNVFINKDFFDKYPNMNMEIHVLESREKDTPYYLQRLDNSYVWSKKTVDDNGNVQSEEIKPEDMLD